MTTPALLTVEYFPIGDLKPDPFNPRRISDEELETLTRSIQQFGLVDPIIVRRADLTVIGGHQRLVAARRLGYDAVPVVPVDLSQEQARLLSVALNKIAGTWDQELLARLLKDLSVVGVSLVIDALSRHRAGPSTGSARDGAGAPTPSTLGVGRVRFPGTGLQSARTSMCAASLRSGGAAHPLPAPPLLLRYGDMRRYGPLPVNTSSVDSFLPSSVQMAPCASQSSVIGRVMVT